MIRAPHRACRAWRRRSNHVRPGALGTLAPDRLSALRRVATIESIGSSTRIEGSKLSDREVEQLLSNLEIRSFATRDEQAIAGY